MADCICPEDGRMVSSDNRVVLMEPGAIKRQGSAVVKDQSRIHIFDKDCPVHGYHEIEQEKEVLDDQATES